MSSPPPATYVAASWGDHVTSNHARGSSDYDEQACNNEDDDDEEEESTASGSEVKDFPRSKRRRQRIHFNVERLQTVYHLPLKTAAERLGICEAALKRICRRNFIQKWPYRQLSSVCRRITELKDRRADMVANRGDRSKSSTRRGFQEHPSFVTPEQFDIKLQQLEEEHDQIIRLAHQPRLPAQSIKSSTTTSSQQCLQDQQEQQRPILNEELLAHLHGVQSTIADLPPLDLSRVDREFPLLLLANVCESVRAYL